MRLFVLSVVLIIKRCNNRYQLLSDLTLALFIMDVKEKQKTAHLALLFV